ncbi:MAG: GAF domain-containing protein [Rhizobiaceae bacterium]|nr:GAF domain-containing protein [Rhizobiaceae bacterium]
MTRDYSEVSQRIAALVEGEDDNIAKMATIACELFQSFEPFHWVGFYRNIGNDTLKIGPYQGAHGCLVIPFGKGVCGACARSGEVQIVDDVNAVQDHIACSASTQSEIVVPVFQGEKLIGVLDIDSDNPAEFTNNDAEKLTEIIGLAFRAL